MPQQLAEFCAPQDLSTTVHPPKGHLGDVALHCQDSWDQRKPEAGHPQKQTVVLQTRGAMSQSRTFVQAMRLHRLLGTIVGAD
jgi:hypothetical protein